MSRICVVGAGSEIAKEYINHRMQSGDQVDQVYRDGMAQLATGLDGIVTFTGTVKNSLITTMSYADWDKVITDTLTSVAQALIDGLWKVRDGGSVVVVGSIVGTAGGYGCANYATAKAGLVGLVRATSNEMIERNIRVNLLELGYVDAGMGARLEDKVKEQVIKRIPMKRFARVDEVLMAIDFLMTQTYMTGGTLTFAGGLR